MTLNMEKLRQKAHELALTDDSFARGRLSKTFLKEFRENTDEISRFLNVLQESTTGFVQPAEETLMDHAGFILEQSLVIHDDQLNKKQINCLPKLRKNGIPRLSVLGKEYFLLTDGEFSEDSLIAYLSHYQEVSVLTLAEVWSLPLFLKIVLLGQLSELVHRIRERREASLYVERLLAELRVHRADPAAFHEILENAEREVPLSGPMIVHLVSHLRESEDDCAAVREWLTCKLEDGADRLDQIQTYEYQLQADYQMLTCNIIDSLRKLERLGWPSIYEQVSRVEMALREEQSGIYPQLDDQSRELLRTRIGRLALRLRVPEVRIAEQAVMLAGREFAGQEEEVPLPRKAMAAFYLLEAVGLKQLQKALAMCGTLRRSSLVTMRNQGAAAYFSLLIASFVVAWAGFAWWLGAGHHLTVFAWIAICCATLIPATEWAVMIVHWFIECCKKPVPLLRYHFPEGVPADAVTMVVVPVIWSSREEVDEMVERLELHYLANRDVNIHFALLGDFADADQERLPGDEDVVERAREGIRALNDKYSMNDKYGRTEGPCFHLFQRRRIWNPCEEVWMGWERKRGKLVEFVELLRGREDTSYEIIVSDPPLLPRIRYLITLDADTMLPLESASRMIAAMHLPYNRPRLNAKGTRVVEGYGVLQPRMHTTYEGAMRSHLTSLWSGALGMDPYAFAVSDPYQDGMGTGIFTGKGIFDVEAFAHVLCERIPENHVLSHDLLEGGFLRAGLLSDTELMDEQPAAFATFQKRLHRWVRGDWQLLCWLFPGVCNRSGLPEPVDLSAITKWQIIDNLRRSLVAPILLLLFILSLTILPGNPIRWHLFLLITLFLPVVRGCLTFRQLWVNPRGFGAVAAQMAVQLVVLPYQSALLLDAAVRSLYRLYISKRHLLEWVSSAEVERRNRGGWQPILLFMRSGYVLIAAALAAAVLQQAAVPRWTGVALALIWAAAPALVYVLNMPRRFPEPKLGDPEREELRQLAAQIWQFFEDSVTAEDHYLPPDNVQIDPPNGVAHRTSPTNIGLYMASALAARDFGFIDTPGLIDRLERTLDTVERLETWHGHLFNWIDTTTLATLQPQYVSTVDSGNFIGSIIAVKEGLAEWLEMELQETAMQGGQGHVTQDGSVQGAESGHVTRETFGRTDMTWRERGVRLIERMESIVDNVQFASLYDAQARLFSLGYDASQQKLDPILYDLMASEARQTSLIAIALGQVPVANWQRLGRAMTRVGTRTAMLSWSGTMFEYLMPCLFMRTYRRTIWSDTCRAVVRRQIRYAAKREVPFGISESGYYAFDYQLNYQYRAFGVPGLGFQRGLESDLVIAPYATILALPFAPDAGIENLRKLEKLGVRGKYGFYEAVDFTTERMPNEKSYQIVRSVMSHHQGMSLLSLANMLQNHGMIDRFHRDKRIQTVEPLLQERIPAKPKVLRHPAMLWSTSKEKKAKKAIPYSREISLGHEPTRMPEIGVYSNGNLTTVVTESGGGFTRFGDMAVTRWREDPVLDDAGYFIYIRDVARDRVWSPTFHPCRISSSDQRVQFAQDRAVYTREDEQIRMTLEIGVSQEWDADVRRLTLLNQSGERRILEVTTYAEIALAPPHADNAHPAFSKLFVETSYEEEAACLLARRRVRDDSEKPVWALHALRMQGNHALGPAEMETDRAEFIGRGFTLSDPQSIRTRLRGTLGAVTDPIFAMRQRLAIEPGEQVQLFAVTCAGETREGVLEAAAQLHTLASVDRAYHHAWARHQIEIRHLRLSAVEAAEFQRLAGHLLYRSPLSEGQAAHIARNVKGQSGLWPHGISGDRPILLVRIDKGEHISFVHKMLAGHEYLRRIGILYDLVLLNESAGGYYQELQDKLTRVVRDAAGWQNGAEGVFVILANTLSEEDQSLLFATARVLLRADGRSLRTQLQRIGPATNLPKPFIPRKEAVAHENRLIADGKERMYFNSWGGFVGDGQQYQLTVSQSHPLPAPWINVLANPHFGCLVSELGTGYTWWRNSREYKLTPWSNDTVLDPPGEIGYFRDEEDGTCWTVFPAGASADQTYEVTHAQGFTQFRHERNDIRHEATVTVALEDPVKLIEIHVSNEGLLPRQLSFTYYAEWVLGVRREDNAAYIVTEWDEQRHTMLVHNTYQENFRGATAFLGLFPNPASWTADRREFIGRNGTRELPAALQREKLSDDAGAVADSCGAIQTQFTVKPGAEYIIHVVLGCGASRDEAVELAEKYRDLRQCQDALRHVRQFWHHTLRQIEVETPNPEMDLLLNGWLLYQTLGCRMWARTAFFQAGGAFGFRDQLQDALGMLHTRPDLARSQILLHAAHQYVEGDVQHWWHEETGRGIRTRFSDDYLWLPYAISRYIEHTGDTGILDEDIPFLHSEPLAADEHERYEITQVSPHSASLYEHGLRAIERSLSRMGEHGLPLIGIGDWNDGMSRIGAKERGESVWLAWFLCDILERYAPYCDMRGDKERAERYRQCRQQLAVAIDRHAWDGQWYRRAFTDDGRWLGSMENAECRIDAIAQSWSILSGAGVREKVEQAMSSFDRELTDRNLSLVRLLYPPFDQTSPSPGYIQGYPPGIRENGGQYTHGAIWGIVAWCMLGQGKQAVEMFNLMNPVHHTKTENEVRRYTGEPYVMAADVYTAFPHEGRAGWTWYTGAAGWMYQAGVEWILGLRRKGNRLYLDPCMPDDWPGYRVRYRFGRTWYTLTIRNGNYSGRQMHLHKQQDQQNLENVQNQQMTDTPGASILLDQGVTEDDEGVYIELQDDGEPHEITWTSR